MYSVMKRIEELKFKIDFPKYFITNYFQNLKNEIDHGFVRDTLSDEHSNKENWLKMISLIESYERECLDKINQKMVSIFHTRLKSIESSIDDYSLSELESLLAKEEAKLQQTLLLNKSYHYIDKSKFKEIDEKKLVIIDNDFLPNHAIDMLNCNQNELNEFTLTDEYIKVRELRTKLVNLNGDVLTINLDLSSKQSLDFFQNQIKTIQAFTFYDLNNLESLYLNNNSIISIDSNLFVKCSNLKQLYLFDNQITSISRNSFMGLINLEWLNLSKNRISSIEAGSFRRLNKLRRLYLQNNELKKIHTKTFQGLKNLEELILVNNQISSIESNAFYDLRLLKELDLSHNSIKSLDASLFEQLNQLNLLYLYSNQIELSELEKLDKFKRFSILYLDFIDNS